MALGSANPLLLAASGGDSDPVTRSLRLDGSESLSRTFGSTGDSKKFTFACWVKRTELGGNQRIFQASNSNNDDFLRFNNDNTLGYWIYQNGSHNHQGNTTAVFRDVSAWMHVCYVVDTAQATAANRVKIFVNGVSHTLSVYPDQNRDCSVMNTAALHYIGRYGNSASEYANLYIADVYFLDGEAVEPVGNFISSNNYGGYKPKEYTGSFGTNGFHLKLDDSSDIGADDAGSNDFTANNLSSHDVMLDTPTKNYATLNPVSDVVASGSNTFSEGNLTLSPSNAYNKAASTIAVSSGKWYAEVRYDSAGNQMAGIGRVDCLENTTNYIGQSSSAFGYVIYRPTGDMYHNGSTTDIFSALSSGDILQIALDLDSNTVWWGLNGTWVGTVGSSGGTSITAAEYYFVQTYRNPCTWNFGQDNTFAGQFTGTPNNDEFAYEIPTGFKSFNSSNLDDPTITPSEYFDVLTYNGAYDNYMNNSGTSPQTITGTDFTPEIVWIKDRDNVSSSDGNGYHGGYWFDNVMGTGYALNTDLDNSSHYGNTLASGEDGISSFNSNGFTVDEAEETNYMADTNYSSTPDTAERYVAWCWKLGSSGSSSTWASGNTNPATEKYNASAGVSIIDFTDSEYSSSAITLNHSLGAAPEFAIAFDIGGYTSGHYVWHKDLSSGNYLTLDSTSSQSSDTSYFPASPASATTFTLGTSISSGTQSHVALFSGVEGYSKFGTYKGNGSSDGPFVYTGFRPSFLMVKRLNSSAPWKIRDAKRDPHNVASKNLDADSSGSEGDYTSNNIDLLSNGFKWRTSGSHENHNGHDFIYAAFAEQPFAAPSNAR